MKQQKLKPVLLEHFQTILTLILILVFIQGQALSNQTANAINNHSSEIQIRIYQLEVTTRYENLTSVYSGIQQLTLNSTGPLTYQGLLQWNLTWDNGLTWQSYNSSFTYEWNRTYEYAGLSCYTAWWISPVVQPGDQIHIDGDVPVTNTFLRTSPFIVKDLVSFEVNQQYYLCWQLVYTSDRQYETFYYEFYTGMLIYAISILSQGSTTIFEAQIQLQSATPPPPSIHFLLHFWTNYNHIILALIGATATSFLIYHLLRKLREHKENQNYHRVYHQNP